MTEAKTLRHDEMAGSFFFKGLALLLLLTFRGCKIDLSQKGTRQSNWQHIPRFKSSHSKSRETIKTSLKESSRTIRQNEGNAGTENLCQGCCLGIGV